MIRALSPQLLGPEHSVGSTGSVNEASFDTAPECNFPFQKHALLSTEIASHQTLKKAMNVIVSLASCGLHKNLRAEYSGLIKMSAARFSSV